VWIEWKKYPWNILLHFNAPLFFLCVSVSLLSSFLNSALHLSHCYIFARRCTVTNTFVNKTQRAQIKPYTVYNLTTILMLNISGGKFFFWKMIQCMFFLTVRAHYSRCVFLCPSPPPLLASVVRCCRVWRISPTFASCCSTTRYTALRKGRLSRESGGGGGGGVTLVLDVQMMF
jgi:hypothetical protein